MKEAAVVGPAAVHCGPTRAQAAQQAAQAALHAAKVSRTLHGCQPQQLRQGCSWRLSSTASCEFQPIYFGVRRRSAGQT